MDAVFLHAPYSKDIVMPSLTHLKQNWDSVNDNLTSHIEKMKPQEWFERHTSVSAEDFLKEPQRNKLNILLTRTMHQSYHLGQLAFLAKKSQD